MTAPPTPILLAAGLGRRLAERTGGRPKCLLEVGGRTLVGRAFDAFAACAIERAIVVTGNQAPAVERAIGALAGPIDVRFVRNARYEEGSIVSLAAGLAAATGDALVLDADVVFAPEVLARLLADPSHCAFAFDETVDDGDEEMMLALAPGGRVLSIDRGHALDRDHQAGEATGIVKVCAGHAADLARVLASMIDGGQAGREYEDGLRRLLAEVDFRAVAIGDLPWIEVDFPDDVERLEREVLPRLRS